MAVKQDVEKVAKDVEKGAEDVATSVKKVGRAVKQDVEKLVGTGEKDAGTVLSDVEHGQLSQAVSAAETDAKTLGSEVSADEKQVVTEVKSDEPQVRADLSQTETDVKTTESDIATDFFGAEAAHHAALREHDSAQRALYVMRYRYANGQNVPKEDLNAAEAREEVAAKKVQETAERMHQLRPRPHSLNDGNP